RADCSFFAPSLSYFTIQPAVTMTTSAIIPPGSVNMYMVSTPPVSPTTTIQLWSLTGIPDPSGPPPAPSATVVSLPINSLAVPPSAQQAGSPTLIDTNDNRLLQSIWAN